MIATICAERTSQSMTRSPKQQQTSRQPGDGDLHAATPELNKHLATLGVDLWNLEQPGPLRGTFSNGPRLAAAVYGTEGDDPARSNGQVLARLGLRRDGHGSYRRLRDAAAHFGLSLPQVPKDGPDAGMSPLADAERVRAAAVGAASLADIARALPMAPNKKTYDRIRARLRELGLPDPTRPRAPKQ